MNLRQLKKKLKQDQRQTANKSRSRLWWVLILLVLVAVAVVPAYRHLQVTAPQRLFVKASKQESTGDLDGAQQLYQQLYQNYPQAELAAQAMLQNAKIWHYDRAQDQQALLSYLQLEHDYPEHELVSVAREAVAHIIKYSQRDYSRAIAAYQRLLDLEDGHQDQYLYEIADCYFRLDNYPQARIELENLLELQPQSPLLAEVLYRKGGLLLLENQPQAARADWLRLVADYPDSSYALQARFNLAKLLEEEDRLADALELYLQLKDFPRPVLLQEKITHLQQRMAAKKKAK